MKNFIDKYINFNRVEFWAVTTLFVFFVFFHISYALQISNTTQPAASGIVRSPFDYYFVSTLIQNTILYLAFLFLNFIVVPKLVKKENILLNVLLVILAFLVTGIVLSMTKTSLRYSMVSDFHADSNTHNRLIQNAFLYTLWLLCMFGFYSVLKYVGLYILSKSEAIQTRFKFSTPGGLIALVAWMIGLFAIIVTNADPGVVAAAAIIPPTSLFLYWYSFYSLIPLSLKKKKPIKAYALRVLLIVSIASFFLGLIAIIIVVNGNQHDDIGAAVGFFNYFFQLFIIAPLCWIVFKRQMKGNEELYFLRKELGQTHASFDFLRSQINPHFLFNALNTIYGTALQEKAERTSEGIEKLGDMMRFMLQENLQDKISLAREIEYLNNYISLQKLRTDPNPTIQIDTFIEHQVSTTQIAPMLLIPFVENAFKHGISFREPSQIKVSLEMKSNTLYFDVYNTKHIRPDNDPEKNKSGIGLNNVRQRLLMTYPGKHELIIRETAKDFFVHLTIQLT